MVACGNFSHIERTLAVVTFCAKCFGIGMYLLMFEESTVNLRELVFSKGDL